MSTRDPHTVILAARLGISEGRARRAVEAFVADAHAWRRWANEGELALLMRLSPVPAGIGEAMVAARLVEREGEGFVLAELDAVVVARILAEEAERRAAGAERTREHRERQIALQNVTARDAVLDRVTERDSASPVASFGYSGLDGVTASPASPITRAHTGAPGARGNSTPPTPNAGDVADLARWLRQFLSYRGFKRGYALDEPQQSELLDAVLLLGLPRERLEGIISEAADRGGRSMVYLRRMVEGALSEGCYRPGPLERAEGRAPPGGDEGDEDGEGYDGPIPVPIEAIREWRDRR